MDGHPKALMTWRAMSGNGVAIGMPATMPSPPECCVIRSDRLRGILECSVAARSVHFRTLSEQLTEPATPLHIEMIALVFGWYHPTSPRQDRWTHTQVEDTFQLTSALRAGSWWHGCCRATVVLTRHDTNSDPLRGSVEWSSRRAFRYLPRRTV